MKITSGSVATFHYRLLKGEQELESSYEGEPMAYLHGYKNIVVGLEEKMDFARIGRKGQQEP